MDRKTVAFLGILLLGLILTSVLLSQSVVQGLTSNSDVTLSVAETNGTHLLGQEIVFSGSIVFAANEERHGGL